VQQCLAKKIGAYISDRLSTTTSVFSALGEQGTLAECEPTPAPFFLLSVAPCFLVRTIPPVDPIAIRRQKRARILATDDKIFGNFFEGPRQARHMQVA